MCLEEIRMDPVLVAVIVAFIGLLVLVIWGKRAFDRAAAASLEKIYLKWECFY